MPEEDELEISGEICSIYTFNFAHCQVNFDMGSCEAEAEPKDSEVLEIVNAADVDVDLDKIVAHLMDRLPNGTDASIIRQVLGEYFPSEDYKD